MSQKERKKKKKKNRNNQKKKKKKKMIKPFESGYIYRLQSGMLLFLCSVSMGERKIYLSDQLRCVLSRGLPLQCALGVHAAAHLFQ
jgi:hypothetical protein